MKVIECKKCGNVDFYVRAHKATDGIYRINTATFRGKYSNGGKYEPVSDDYLDRLGDEICCTNCDKTVDDPDDYEALNDMFDEML